MSFGWSAGDILAFANLLWKVSEALSSAHGASTQHASNAIMLKEISKSLRLFARTLEKYSNLLEQEDIEGYGDLKAQLGPKIGTLSGLVEKAVGMGLDERQDGNRRRWRDWPSEQVGKIRWSFFWQEGAEKLITEIWTLTGRFGDFYHQINIKLHELQQQALQEGLRSNQQAITTNMAIIQTRLGTLDTNVSLITQELTRQKYSVILPQLGSTLPIGPQAGFPPGHYINIGSTNPTPLGIRSSLAHLQNVTCATMDARASSKIDNLKADYPVKNKLLSWLAGTSPSRLWLQGPDATLVSASVFKTGLQRDRDVIGVAVRHVDDEGKGMTHQERLFKMVYSLLYQALRRFQESKVDTVFISGVNGNFDDLDVSMQSMPLALRFFDFFLALLPKCVVIVDGWHFIGNGDDGQVNACLKEFLGVFDKLAEALNDCSLGKRLLLTSLGSSPILTDMGRENVDVLNVTPHIGKGIIRLSTNLADAKW